VNNQIELDFRPTIEAGGTTIPERFKRFHSANPHIYAALVNLARAFRAKRGSRKLGMKMLYEVLRWNYYMTTDSDEEYKLSNDFSACYSRLIMEQEPDLAEIFNKRFSVADFPKS
jgi:hypothetical protein